MTAHVLYFSSFWFCLWILIRDNKTSWLLDNGRTTTALQTIQKQNYIRKTDRPTNRPIWLCKWYANTMRPEQRMSECESCSANLINDLLYRNACISTITNTMNLDGQRLRTQNLYVEFFDVLFFFTTNVHTHTHYHTNPNN